MTQTTDASTIDASEVRAAGGLTVPQLEALEREFGNVEAAIRARPDLADLLRQAQVYWGKQAEILKKWQTVVEAEDVLEALASKRVASDDDYDLAVRGIAAPPIERFGRERQEAARRALQARARIRAIWRPRPRPTADLAPVPAVARRPATTGRARPAGRRRATTRAAASRGSPDDDPEPGGAGLQRLQRLRVIAPAEFRRQLQRALGGSA